MEAGRKALREAPSAAGVDVLIDDRDQRPGREVQGRRPDRHPACGWSWAGGLKEGQIEVKWRSEPEAKLLPLEGVPLAIATMIRDELLLSRADQTGDRRTRGRSRNRTAPKDKPRRHRAAGHVKAHGRDHPPGPVLHVVAAFSQLKRPSIGGSHRPARRGERLLSRARGSILPQTDY